MTPCERGRSVLMPTGVRPIIFFAAAPKAMISFCPLRLRLRTAMTDGSSIVTPFDFT